MPYLVLSEELLYKEQSLPCMFVCVNFFFFKKALLKAAEKLFIGPLSAQNCHGRRFLLTGTLVTRLYRLNKKTCFGFFLSMIKGIFDRGACNGIFKIQLTVRYWTQSLNKLINLPCDKLPHSRKTQCFAASACSDKLLR